MKKIISVMAVAVLTLSMIGCGGKKEPAKDAVAVADAVEILTKTYESFDDDKMFPIGGGSYENMTADVPGAIDPADTESLAGLLQFPSENADMIDDAASMLHMMNANTFTAGAYHVTDAANQQALADALKDAIMNAQWMCGFPEKLYIAGINDDYVVAAYGTTDLVEHFETKLADNYGAASLYEESLM